MALFSIIVLMFCFWVSIGFTEGWKWRQDHKNLKDDNKYITYESYHLWRLLTNVTPILLVLSASCVTVSSYWLFALFVLATNMSAAVAYEFCLGFAETDKWLIKRADFNVMGRTIPRPEPLLVLNFGIICLVVAALAAAYL